MNNAFKSEEATGARSHWAALLIVKSGIHYTDSQYFHWQVAGNLELLAQLVNTRSHLSTTIMNVCTPRCTQANWDM